MVWERKHRASPIYNAIVWQDTRTDAICNELAREGGQDRFRARPGCPWRPISPDPRSSGSWIMCPVPRQRAENGELLFGNMDTWLIWNLTGVHVTDVTNASRTL